MWVRSGAETTSGEKEKACEERDATGAARVGGGASPPPPAQTKSPVKGPAASTSAVSSATRVGAGKSASRKASRKPKPKLKAVVMPGSWRPDAHGREARWCQLTRKDQLKERGKAITAAEGTKPNLTGAL